MLILIKNLFFINVIYIIYGNVKIFYSFVELL
jgi:hypothetical protein